MGRAKFTNEKTVPGDAYVTDTHKFLDLVMDACLKLPKKWETYLLRPLFEAAVKIDNDVTEANKIYLKEDAMEPEQLLKGLEDRIDLLNDALRTFAAFDQAFDRLMRQFDMLDTDFRYMYSKIAEAVKKEDPEKKLDVKIHGTDNFFSYTADINGEKVTVHFSRQKKDQILDAEALSKERIGDRRSKDQKWFKKLKRMEDGQSEIM